MNEKINILSVIKFAGAYIAYVIGSGFATGQEILQFFTVYGTAGLWAIGISAVLFSWIGAVVMGDGYQRGEEAGVYKFYCGPILGTLYEIIVPLILFGVVTVMISGAGAVLWEYYGIHYHIGCSLMAGAVLASYFCGFRRLVDMIGFSGPVIIFFTLLVAGLTLKEGFAHGEIDWEAFSYIRQGRYSWWFSGILYVSFNVVGGIAFFRALGASAGSRKEAAAGGLLGGLALMTAVLAMDLAFMAEAEAVNGFAIPTLYLAESISPVLAAAFSAVLLIEIFSTAAPMTWSACRFLAREGTLKSRIIGAAFVTTAFLCGLLPFEALVGTVYPYIGIMGLLLIVAIFIKKVTGLLRLR